MTDSPRSFDPATVSKLSGLELKARTIVEGFVSGRHRSPFRGFSAEFAEHREYSPGDDLRYLDWKVFGKSDRYYVKDFEQETNFTCYLVVDSSESMRYRSETAAMSKIEYARCLAAALAFLVLRQQDAIGLATFDDRVNMAAQPSSQQSHAAQVFHWLQQAVPAGDMSIGTVLEQLAERVQRRSLFVVVSDLFGDASDLASGLKHMRYNGHDVSVLQVVDPAEQEFPFDEPTLFKGLESQGEHMTEPRSLARAYRREFKNFLESVQGACRDAMADWILLRTDTPFDIGLSRYLITRMRHGRRSGTTR